jgi:hypothetical protein
MMTASNIVLEGLANGREEAILPAGVDAVEWKHAALEQEDASRKGQRVVIYPKEMIQLEQVLSTGDPNVDSVNGHPIAYTRLLQAAQSYERTPIFLKEDSEQITYNPEIAAHVPVWMNTAAQVATRNRKMVLEDGPDKMNSDDDDALEDVKPDEEKGMYTPEMDPRQGPVKISAHEAARQRAASQASKTAKTQEPDPRQSPVCGSSDDDDPAGSEWIWSQTKGCMRENKHCRPSAPTADTIETNTPPTADTIEIIDSNRKCSCTIGQSATASCDTDSECTR